MKTKSLVLFFLITANYLNGAVTLSGTSLLNVTGVSGGDFAAYVVSLDGTPISAANFSFAIGADLTSSATYGSSFALIATRSAQNVFGNISVSSGINFDLTGGIDTGDSFGILTFDTSTTTALSGDTFRVWTAANWDVPTDGQTESFDSELIQLNSVSASSIGTVVPEPSAFAFIAGALGLMTVALRRRR